MDQATKVRGIASGRGVYICYAVPTNMRKGLTGHKTVPATAKVGRPTSLAGRSSNYTIRAERSDKYTMIILKFGGTSVSSKVTIATICEIVRERLPQKPIVVVSALSGVTDLFLSIKASPHSGENAFKRIRDVHCTLIRAIWCKRESADAVISYVDDVLHQAETVLKKHGVTKSSLDRICASGEMMSSYIICEALKKSGIAAQQVLAAALIVTNDNFGSAEFIPEPTRINAEHHLRPLVDQRIVPVVTGFIAATEDGRMTTLGRGGSDYSAAILGYSLHAEEIQIWTDVDGVFTADPRLVPSARVLEKISYKEASELASFGAKVLHPKTIRPAMTAGIPVRVLNTFNPRQPGTLILENFESERRVTAITSKTALTLVNIYSTDMLFSKGFLAKVFEIFSRHDVSMDLVSVSEVSVSLTCDDTIDLGAVSKEIEQFAAINISREFAMVSLIGNNVAASPGTISRIFAILEEEGILVRMVSLGSASINVSLVIKREEVARAVQVLHDKMITSTA